MSKAKVKEDNWIHRSEGMRCQTCMWFVLKEARTKTSLPVGRCRKMAPTMNGWPVLFPTDWCGQHKLDENK